MGPLVAGVAVEEMFDALEKIKEQGGEIVAGGNPLPDLGPNFVEPTIIRMPKQTEIVKQETFAPILYLLEYDTMDQAMKIHNEVPQGLSSAIFTDSMRTVETFLSSRGSDCGIANVNIGTSGAEIGGCFWRGEGDRRRPRVRLGRVEGLHAPTDEYDQLVQRAAAGAGHRVRIAR